MPSLELPVQLGNLISRDETRHDPDGQMARVFTADDLRNIVENYGEHEAQQTAEYNARHAGEAPQPAGMMLKSVVDREKALREQITQYTLDTRYGEIRTPEGREAFLARLGVGPETGDDFRLVVTRTSEANEAALFQGTANPDGSIDITAVKPVEDYNRMVAGNQIFDHTEETMMRQTYGQPIPEGGFKQLPEDITLPAPEKNGRYNDIDLSGEALEQVQGIVKMVHLADEAMRDTTPGTTLPQPSGDLSRGSGISR